MKNKTKKIYVCPICNFKHENQLEVELHQLCNDHYKTYICESCKFTSRDKNVYYGHFASGRHFKSKYRFDD